MDLAQYPISYLMSLSFLLMLWAKIKSCVEVVCCSYGWLFMIYIVGLILLALFGTYLRWGKPRHISKKKGEELHFSVRGVPPSRKDLYSAAIQLTIHAENTTWTRTSSFLFANSILMLAWAPFGSRTRRYLDAFVKVSTALEPDVPPPLRGGPVDVSENLKFLRGEGICRSRNLIIAVPLLFAAVFFAALLKSLCLLAVP
jgi:hypothetical protein